MIEKEQKFAVTQGFWFFFSSRRRHTRCSRDWSSDVCSSDLVGKAGDEAGDRLCLQVPLVDLLVKKRQEVNSRLLRRCLRVEGMDALIRAPDPASFLIRTDLS